MSRMLALFSNLLFFVSLSFLSPAQCRSSNPPVTVYELFPKFGLPQGLLPNTVTNYTHKDDGHFVAVLPSPCYVQFEFLVYYDKIITGKLAYGSITELKGIRVKRFLLWFDVDEIKVDLPPSDSVYFQMGFINKRLDVAQFKTVHSCLDDKVSRSGCGSWTRILQLLTRNNEVEMLITE